jgi:fucose permease
MALFLHERRQAAKPGVSAPETGYTRREVIRQPAFWLMAVASFFWLFAFGHVMHLVSFLTSNGLTRSKAATYAGVLGATSMIGRVVTGFVIDRVNVSWFCALVFSMQAAALVVLGLFDARFALVAIAVMGFSHGAENDCIPYLTAGYFGLRCFGEIFGLIVMATVLGSALGPFAFGFMREVSGDYSLPYIVMAACAAGAAILMSCLRRHPYLVDVARAER